VSADTLRIVSWNATRLAPLLREDAAISLLDVHHRFGRPDVLCLQEIRIRPGDAELIQKMKSALPDYRCEFNLNRDARNATFAGGRCYGVATWIHASLSPTAAIVPAWDLEGRVVGTILPSWNLALFNIYAVNGTAKAYFDPQTGEACGDRHGFKRKFIERLGAFVAPMQPLLDIVLIGDWNISQTRLDTWPRLRTQEPHALARKAFQENFVEPLNLIDCFRQTHPEARQYTWFNPRTPKDRMDAARVDFALVSAGLANRVDAADIDESAQARFPSDHAPITLQLRAAKETPHET
jgi:exodeoxyribonuclease III